MSKSTKRHLPDVDIDVADRARALEGFTFTPASQIADGRLKKHNTGVYFQNVPYDPVQGVCALPSGKNGGELASVFGFAKVDILPNHAYEGVRNPDHLREILSRPVPWEKFDDEVIVKQLQQINAHFTLVEGYQPRSIEDLACVIALIRPGKRHLVGQDMETVKSEVWKKVEGGYTFKKSHAIAFAMMIVVQLQVLLETGNGWQFDERSNLRDSEEGGGPNEGN